MKRAHPKLSSNLVDVGIETMVDDGELESAHLFDQVARNCNVADLRLIDVLIEEVQLMGSHLSRIVARDTVIRRSDLSSASLDNGMLVRVEFINCRMSDVDFSQTSIHDVTFKDCKLNGVNFAKADLRRVAFIGCSLQGVDFEHATTFDIEKQ